MRKYIFKDKFNILLYLLISGAGAGFAALLPLITADFINNIGELNKELLLRYGLGYVLAVAGILLFEYFTKLQGLRVEKRFMVSVRNDLFKGITNMNYKTFSGQDSGYYVEAITEDASTLYVDYFETVIGFLENGIKIIVYFGFMFYMNPILSSVILLFSVISAFVPSLGGKRMATLRSEASNKNADYLTRLTELLDSFVIINSRTVSAIRKRHNDACEERQQAMFKYKANKSFFEIFTGLFCYLINIAAFASGIVMIAIGKLSAGEFVGLLSFIEVLTIPVRDFSYLVIHFGASSEIKEKLEQIAFRSVSEKKEGDSYNELRLENISFRYDDFMLEDVNLTFEKGKKYAIIGESGSGKSTLLKTIAGLVTPDSGKIYVDGVPDDSDARINAAAYIGQSTVIFNAGIKDNATVFGSYSDEGFDAFVKNINAERLLRDDFGEDGDKISGGEKNKIALLRALCEGKEILLCDEMFAALDIKSRKVISDYILNDKRFTVISVTHDTTEEMLSYYDMIITMKNGHVDSVKENEKTSY